jgi:prepilin-type N-terminal cleavage/methylation domain-containing protein
MCYRMPDTVVVATLVRRASRSGFTLIELLVVIAIIALLIAILLPSLEAARRASKKATCNAHIKNIATSSRVYEADDPSGWGIPVHPGQYTQDSNNPTFIGAYEWGGKSGIGQDDYIPGQVKPHGSKYGTKAGFGPPTRPMNNILYPGGFKDNNAPFNRAGAVLDTKLDLGLYKCPADDGPPRGGHCQDWIDNDERSSYDHFGNSFAANVFLTGYSDSAYGLGSISPYMRPVSRVPTPARTIYYEENIGRWAWAARRDECPIGGLEGIDVGPTKSLAGWHGRDWTYNRAFVDAHAETQRIYLEGTEDSDGFAEHYRNEELSSYPSWLDGTEGYFDRYQCIIVRGNGWQKDTLPAAILATGLRSYSGDRPSYEGCVSD